MNVEKMCKMLFKGSSYKMPKVKNYFLVNCCRKTSVCIGDQLLDFSVPGLVRSQSTLRTDPEVVQNCAGFTLCSSAGLAVCDERGQFESGAKVLAAVPSISQRRRIY